MFTSQILYFTDSQGNVLLTLKKPSFVPKANEQVIINGDKRKIYYVHQVVYTVEKNKYTCWVYLNDL